MEVEAGSNRTLPSHLDAVVMRLTDSLKPGDKTPVL